MIRQKHQTIYRSAETVQWSIGKGTTLETFFSWSLACFCLLPTKELPAHETLDDVVHQIQAHIWVPRTPCLTRLGQVMM